jgi:hypothetical protein
MTDQGRPIGRRDLIVAAGFGVGVGLAGLLPTGVVAQTAAVSAAESWLGEPAANP